MFRGADDWLWEFEQEQQYHGQRKRFDHGSRGFRRYSGQRKRSQPYRTDRHNRELIGRLVHSRDSGSEDSGSGAAKRQGIEVEISSREDDADLFLLVLLGSVDVFF